MRKNDCATCGAPRADYESFLGAGDLCLSCAMDEVAGLLNDVDADGLAKLRRRVEDVVRKSPTVTRAVAALAIVEDWIRYDDILGLDA